MGAENSKKSKKSKDNQKNTDGSNDKKNPEDKNSNINTNIITILIPLEQGYWEKQYNAKEKLSQIENDFKEENEIPKDIQIDWTYKNELIKMDDQKINSLIQDNNTTTIAIHIQINNYKLNGSFLKSKNINETGTLFGKPFFLPFEIIIFDKKHRSFKTESYTESLISSKNLDKCNPTSAYCNGNNHLYISGGVDNQNNLIGMFWDINLEDSNDITNIQINGKKNHSMICISKNIFIVGGNDENTYYYNYETKKISNWVNLNFKRVEPALIKFQNFLYCFDSLKDQNNEFSFERVDISSKEPIWEILHPNFSQNLNNNNAFSQKFYGVTKDINEESIIFLGGSNENYDPAVTPNLNEIKCLKYNVKNNLIELSNVQYKEFFLKEKTFIYYNQKADFIMPDFDKKHEKIVFYLKEKNMIQIVNYKHRTNKKLNNKNNLLSTRKNILSRSLNAFKIDFAMPGIYAPNENIITTNVKTKTGTEIIEKNDDNSKKDDFKENVRITNIEKVKKTEKKIEEIKPNVENNEQENEINLGSDLSLGKDKESEKSNNNNAEIIQEEKTQVIIGPKPEDEKKEIPETKDVNNEEEKIEKENKEKEKIKNKKVEEKEIKNTIVIISPYSKFHSSCYDPDNSDNKNVIKNVRKNLHIPSYTPERRDIKKLTRAFNRRRQIEMK